MARKKKEPEAAPAPAPTTDPEGIYLVELVEENFRRLTFAHVEVQEGGRLLRVTGPNRSGKTSLLEGILALFRGTRAVPEESLRDDSPTGRVWARFSNGFQIERRFTQAAPKGYLKIVSADGGKYSQELIDAWLGGADADPMYLWALDPKKRRTLLMSLAGPEVDAELENIRRRVAGIEDDRRPFNSTLQRVNRLDAPAFPKPEPVDVGELSTRYQALRDAQQQRLDHDKELQQLHTRVRYAQERVAGLEEELAAARDALDTVSGELSDMQNEEVPPDPSEELVQVRQALGRADEDRARLMAWAAYEEEMALGEKAAAKSRELTAERDALLAKKADLVKGMGTDVPGLSFDDEGEPLIFGKPENYASGAEKALFAVDVCLALNPKLKLALVDEGEALDDDSLAALARRGAEKGFAVLVCTLGREGPGEIVVADGVALSEGKEAPAPAEELPLERTPEEKADPTGAAGEVAY